MNFPIPLNRIAVGMHSNHIHKPSGVPGSSFGIKRADLKPTELRPSICTFRRPVPEDTG